MGILGKPRSLLTDGGPEFRFDLDAYGVRRKWTVPYAPQSNGVVERANQVMLNYVYEKILKDVPRRCVVIYPVWKEFPWFWGLEKIRGKEVMLPDRPDLFTLRGRPMGRLMWRVKLKLLAGEDIIAWRLQLGRQKGRLVGEKGEEKAGTESGLSRDG